MGMASHKLPSLIGPLGLRNDAANDITMRYQDAVVAIDRDSRYKASSFCIIRADQGVGRGYLADQQPGRLASAAHRTGKYPTYDEANLTHGFAYLPQFRATFVRQVSLPVTIIVGDLSFLC
jgi:hypothetical protein